MGGAPEALVGDMNRTVICDFLCSGNVLAAVTRNKQPKSTEPDLLYHFTKTHAGCSRIAIGKFTIDADSCLFSLALFRGLLLGPSLPSAGTRGRRFQAKSLQPAPVLYWAWEGL